jgi:hypothetical protein
VIASQTVLLVEACFFYFHNDIEVEDIEQQVEHTSMHKALWLFRNVMPSSPSKLRQTCCADTAFRHVCDTLHLYTLAERLLISKDNAMKQGYFPISWLEGKLWPEAAGPIQGANWVCTSKMRAVEAAAQGEYSERRNPKSIGHRRGA